MRSLLTSGFVFLLALPAAAQPVSVDVTLSFIPPGPTTLPPGSPDFSNLTLEDGIVTLYSNQAIGGPGGGMPVTLDPPGPTSISPLAAGETFSIVFHPPNPCLPAGACELDFSFAGMTGSFATLAFGAPPPNTIPPGPNVIPIGVLIPPGPQTSPAPVEAGGDLVAFDSPIVVGTWEVTMAVAPEPSTWAMMLLGFVVLGYAAYRRTNGDSVANFA